MTVERHPTEPNQLTTTFGNIRIDGIKTLDATGINGYSVIVSIINAETDELLDQIDVDAIMLLDVALAKYLGTDNQYYSQIREFWNSITK